MLHIILTILKVIGIIAALILLLILLVGCIVLFVPVQYRIRGKKRECDLEAEVRISWMFRMISAEIQQKKKMQFTIKIFGKTLEQWKELLKKIKKKKIKKETEQQVFPDPFEQKAEFTFEQESELEEKKEIPNETRPILPENFSETKAVAPIEKNEKESEHDVRAVSFSEEEKAHKEIRREKTGRKRLSEFPKRIWDKIKAINYKMKKFWKNLKKRYQGIKSSLTKVKEMVNYYIALFREEKTKQAIQFCKAQFIWMMKKIAPKKIKGEVQFGTGDPATTGELMGLLSVFLPIYSYSLELNPDFENKILEGEIELAGSVKGWYFLILAWRFFRNKEIKYVMKKIKR